MYNAVVVLGPTACGKTAVGVGIAARCNGEVVSADSRQVYRHLDIGSGKDLGEYTVATATGDRLQVPYHLIDVAQLPQEYSVYDYQRDAYQSIASILAQGRLPVARTFMPRALAIRPTARPMRPKPMMPMVFPASSMMGVFQ